MTEEEKGRFCNVCSKTVYDFTDASPEEFFKIYRENRGQICGRFYNEPLGFWQTTKNKAVQLLKQSKAAVIAISLGVFSTKVITAHTLQANPISITVDEDTEFVSISVNIKDSYTKKLVKQDFKVTVKLDDYDVVINKVSNGTATFSIPKDLLDTRGSIKIESIENNETMTTFTMFSASNSEDIYVASSKKAKRRELKAERKRKKRRRNAKWRTIGCPEF